MESVYLIYEGDEWLATDSLVLMGVFTNQKKLWQSARQLIRQRAKANADEPVIIKDFVREELECLKEHLQTYSGSYRFLIKVVEPNVIDEI